MPATTFVVAGLVFLLAAFTLLWFVRKQRTSGRKINETLSARLRIVEEQSARAIVLVGADGLIRKLTPAAQKCFGYADSELLERSISLLTRRIPPSGASGADVEVTRKDGSRLWMHCHAAEISREETYVIFDEAPKGMTTNEHPQTVALEIAERVVNRIVKQLEGLLTTINGYTELALHETGENIPLRKDLEEIAAASDAASYLARHLLAFSGNLPIPVECVDLNALLESLRAKFQAVQMEVSAEHLYVLANPQCLLQIVTVFCGSASRRAGAQATKQIVTGRRRRGSAEYASISISDGGPALPAATLDCLFEPLFLDRESLGVELSGVYGMLRNFGGSINVASDEERGTTFEILIPLAG
jgi:PAS domain S-box-containing protein